PLKTSQKGERKEQNPDLMEAGKTHPVMSPEVELLKGEIRTEQRRDAESEPMLAFLGCQQEAHLPRDRGFPLKVAWPQEQQDCPP
ncbi:Hypothetical predicted protein, partial [Marmota monax]